MGFDKISAFIENDERQLSTAEGEWDLHDYYRGLLKHATKY